MPAGIQILIGFAVGGGWACCWAGCWAGAIRGPADPRLENELRAQLARREAEARQAAEQADAGPKPQRPRRRPTRRRREKLLAEQRQWHEQNLREAKAAQDKGVADLREAFKALSADARQSAPEFLRLAEQSFGKFQETADPQGFQRHVPAALPLIHAAQRRFMRWCKSARDGSFRPLTPRAPTDVNRCFLHNASKPLRWSVRYFG